MKQVTRAFRLAVGLGLVALVPALTAAQTDEIQVYEGDIAPPGVFNLTFHTNFTPRGQTTPSFADGVVADKSFNQVPEWAYGVTQWFEAGLYLPVYNRDRNLGWGVDGFKPRVLFVVPRADERTFFYGVNFEFSVNARRWDASRFTSEIRPIVGWHVGAVDVVINPILDTAYDGLKNLTFAPSSRVAYHLTDTWAVGAEEYDDYGPIHHLAGLHAQVHQIYGVLDRRGTINVEAGVGVGMTGVTDALTLKLILSVDLNARSRTVKHD